MSVPSLPGRRAVTKPAPFRRPRVEVSRSEKRVWAHVPVHTVVERDTLSGFGVVAVVGRPEDGSVALVNSAGQRRIYVDGEASVFAFVAANPT